MKLLVVEDEARVASFLDKGLRANGYDVEWARSGQEALHRAAQPDISLVILDLGLPDLDGLDVLEGLRAGGSPVPVLVLSARGSMRDRVRGLDLGADDYLGKPFAFQELLARVRANLRPSANAGPSLLRAGGICLDLLRREVTLGGRTVDLSDREFFLLKAFVGHPRRTLTRQELLAMAWGMTFDPGTNLVDVYVGYLRRKLGETVIETVRGAGYCLRIDGRPASALSLARTATQFRRPDRDTSRDTHNTRSGALAKRDNHPRITDHNGGSARVLTDPLRHSP